MEDIKIYSEGKVTSRIISGSTVAEVIRYISDYKSVFIIFDEAVSKFADSVSSALSIPETASLSLRINEENKNLETVGHICEWLLTNNAERTSLLLCIGGGITSDIGGFAASIYKRGIDFAYIPTTLLSQVDAGIGGKTGVNFLDYKNMLGIIRQPIFTYECPEVLTTLPYRDFRSGSAEMLKTFIIENQEDNYNKAVKILSEIYSADDKEEAIASRKSDLLHLIREAAKVKAGIVSRDEFERGERKKLNLGHTFGHAIEWLANSGKSMDISHGEAVAIGTIIAAKLSECLGVSSDKCLSERLIKDFTGCGLPTVMPFSPEDMEPALSKDKKGEEGMINFILIKDIGEVVIQKLTAREAINKLKQDEK